jgi:hypothetical protein
MEEEVAAGTSTKCEDWSSIAEEVKFVGIAEWVELVRAVA